MKPFFSVIIPALNEEHYIVVLLEALKKQTFKDFEVILVDANSNDKTIEKAEKFNNDFPFLIISTKIHNVSKSRNLGATIAKGSYLFFIDADNQIPDNFLFKAKLLIEQNKEIVIPFLEPDSDRFTYKFLYEMQNYLVLFINTIGFSFSTSGSIIIKNDIFKAVNGFDTKVYVGEEHVIVNKARKINAKIAIMSKDKVKVSVRRFETDGLLMFAKYFIANIYIILFGKITKKIYKYQMGGQYFDKKEST